MGKFNLSAVTRRMGCRGSKEEDEGTGGKNGGTSSSGAGASGGGGAGTSAAVPASDPRIPMTAKQKYSLVASWKGIHRALEPTGILMFVK